ncbi:MAG: periplasmic heavy metal sensor [Candidatus Zixiibacteriota bacterium]
MKRKLIILGILLLIAINISALATVGYRWKYGSGSNTCGGCAPGEYICQQLSLSDSQRQNVEACRKVFTEGIDLKREILNHKRNELVDLISQPVPNPEMIDSLLKEIGIAQTELEKDVVNHILHEKELLNPEQQKKFLDLIKGQLLPQGKCERVMCPSERR